MATILTLAGGLLGLIAALVSLALGGGFLTALLLWSATGLSATLLALAYAALPRQEPASFRA